MDEIREEGDRISKNFPGNCLYHKRTPLSSGWQSGGAETRVLSSYQRSFRPNWICRELVDVEVMTPAVGEMPDGVSAITLGVLKLA